MTGCAKIWLNAKKKKVNYEKVCSKFIGLLNAFDSFLYVDEHL